MVPLGKKVLKYGTPKPSNLKIDLVQARRLRLRLYTRSLLETQVCLQALQPFMDASQVGLQLVLQEGMDPCHVGLELILQS